jgi:hypothetical protein
MKEPFTDPQFRVNASFALAVATLWLLLLVANSNAQVVFWVRI